MGKEIFVVGAMKKHKHEFRFGDLRPSYILAAAVTGPRLSCISSIQYIGGKNEVNV
jgi:hypothetical protein